MGDVTEANAFANPHLWLAGYGIRSHYFVWAVAHGALDDIDPLEPGHEGFIQAPLFAGMDALVQLPTRASRRRIYRSRSPHRGDVLVEDQHSRRLRKMLGIRLRDEFVIR